ncbi:LysE/ArgO family amino acid transporter [Salinithrix halophila]|uniref:LysE/ArgO family amino acid transporter n=1 Tax=Salinithrix halophila TaxID=1485204 RepID=A0ABV8JBT5_9BACL
MYQAFIHGFLLAFGLVLPLGIQNVFIFNQGAIQPRLWRAYPAVLTAAACDALLILLAVTGVSLLVLQFTWLETILFGVGFFFLCYMGLTLWKSVSPEMDSHRSAERFPAKRQILFTVSVSLLNPHAILDTVGVIGTSSLTYQGSEKWVFTLASILVSFIWFISLAAAGRLVGSFDSSGKWMIRLNRASALLIWGMALWLGGRLITA